MTRPLDEVVRLQRAMVERLNTKGAALDEEQLHRGLAAHREEIRKWMTAAEHVESIEIDYPALINDPQSVIPKVVEFLGGERLPHAGEMLSAIDASLHRQKG